MFSSVISILIHLGLLCVINAATQGPTASTRSGQVRGKVISTSKGDCNVYLGVPFAAPPIGDLRWQKPAPVPSWSGVKDATEFSPKCIQISNNGSNIDLKQESEDCLYLNIFAPKSASSSSKLPVMVFIHGGGMVIDSGQSLGVTGVCQNMATRGVIIVIIQYRLGLFGLLSTGDSVAPGNYLVWDQIEALKWVEKNIGDFGGDPAKVTIFGESSGAASISFLTYTTVGQDLWQQSISESDSAHGDHDFPLRDTSVPTTKNLAKAAKCSSDDSKSMMDCLRSVPLADFLKIYTAYKQANYPTLAPLDDLPVLVTMRVDGELFTSSKLVDLSNKKPAIIGCNSNEVGPKVDDIPVALQRFDAAISERLTANVTDATKIQILKDIAYYLYLDSKGDRNNSLFVVQQIAKFNTDTRSFAPAALEAASKAAAGRPVWVYYFDPITLNDLQAAFPGYPFDAGTPHGADLCFLFDSDLGGPPSCPPPLKPNKIVVEYMGEMWTNFAKNGNPSPKDIVWPNYHSFTNASTLSIRQTLSIQPQFFLEADKFWNQLVPAIKSA